MNENENNQKLPEENAPRQDTQYSPQPRYGHGKGPDIGAVASGCLGTLVKTVLILLAIIAFTFFACLFTLSGPC